MRALLAADYLSRLDSFPVAYPSYRVLGLELGAPSIPAYDEGDPTPYRRAVWTAQQRGRRALRDLEDAGLLKRREHCAEANGAQRANDYLALTPALVVGLLLRAAGWGGGVNGPWTGWCPPRGQDGAPSEKNLQPERDKAEQQSAPPPPTATQPVSRVAPPLVSAAASAFSTSTEGSATTPTTPTTPTSDRQTAPGPALTEGPPGGPARPGGGQPAVALSELTRRRLAGALAPPALLAVLAFCARPAHEPLAELGVSALLRALERGPVGNPVGYVCNVIRDELAQRQEAAAARAHDDGDRGSGGEGGELGGLVADLVERLSMPAPDPRVAQLEALERQRQRLVHAIQALPFGAERDRLRDAHAQLVEQIRKLRGAHA